MYTIWLLACCHGWVEAYVVRNFPRARQDDCYRAGMWGYAVRVEKSLK